jgi:fimbrial chaperone protein
MLLLAPVSLVAYSVTPNVLALRPGGDSSSAFLHLSNRETRPAAIELTISRYGRNLDGQGSIQEDADDLFLIYPAQVVLMPGEEVGVQVRWIGEPVLDRERCFVLVTREVPLPRAAPKIEAEPPQGITIDLTVLLNYEVRVYVTPPGARAKVTVESVQASPTDGTEPETPMLEVTLLNSGTARATLAEASLRLMPETGTSGAPAARLTARDIPALALPILAGERRRLRFPRPSSLPAGPVRATLLE